MAFEDIAAIGADNQPDEGGAGAPPVAAPVSLPSVAAAALNPPAAEGEPTPPAGLPSPLTTAAIQQLMQRLQPAAEPSPLVANLRKYIPLIAAAYTGATGQGAAGAAHGWQTGLDAEQNNVDRDALAKERIAQAISKLQAENDRQQQMALYLKKMDAYNKSKAAAAQEKVLTERRQDLEKYFGDTARREAIAEMEKQNPGSLGAMSVPTRQGPIPLNTALDEMFTKNAAGEHLGLHDTRYDKGPKDVVVGSQADWVTQSLDLATKQKGAPLDPAEKMAAEAAALKVYKTVGQDADYEDLKKASLDLRNQIAQLALTTKQTQNEPPNIDPGTANYRIAQDLAYGKLPFKELTTLISARASGGTNVTALKIALYDKARQLNPDFNPAEFEMGFAFAKNPKVQQQLSSLDNVIQGIPSLITASEAAARSNIKTLNERFIIPGGIQFGDHKYSDLHAAQIAFADELSGALGYGSATDMSRGMGVNMTDVTLSPEQFKSAIETVVLPFVQRKRASMLRQMSIYGKGDMNPAGQDNTPPSSTTPQNPFR